MTLYYNIEQQRCPHCGKVTRLFRFGAMLTPVKAAILDLVCKRPGIQAETIRHLLFGNEVSRRNVIVHISAINDALAHTDYFIGSRREAGVGYRLMKRRAEA